MSSEESSLRRKADVVAMWLIGIVAVVVLINSLYRGVVTPRETMYHSTCLNNQAQLAKAVLQYEALHGHYPGYANTSANNTRHGWVTPLLPYLGYKDLEWTTDASYLQVMVCPSDKPEEAVAGYNHYVVNCGQPDAVAMEDKPADWKANGVFFDHGPDVANKIEIDSGYIQHGDGCATTLMLTENLDAGLWTSSQEPEIGFVYSTADHGDQDSPQPKILPFNQQRGEGDGSYRFARPSSNHPGGVMVTFCDGHQQFFAEDTENGHMIWALLMSPNGSRSRRAGSDVRVPVLADTPVDESSY